MSLQVAEKSQRLAAYPHHSAWVAASAGSGKTKVLTDRVLNLLLEGCPMERILCLTFTKAAAAEMANRVRERLGEWAILPDHELEKSLENLQGMHPSAEKRQRARKLFNLTLDTPGGLKIQTIHSFCQSLLKRFPLEAGLSPFFEVVGDSERQQILKKATHLVMEDSSLSDSLKEIVIWFSELTLEEFNISILQMKEELRLASHDKIDQVLHTKNLTQEELRKALVEGIPESKLKENLDFFKEGSPTDQERGRILSHYLSLSKNEKILKSDIYLDLFLTQTGEKRSRLLTQKIALKVTSLYHLLEEEACRLEVWMEKNKALEIATVSKALLEYSLAFLKAYENLKKSQSLLDYDDLILKTAELLKNPGCHWVLYKLDGGLDHILVDEAQDTSPAQWQVIRAIAEEFYANAGENSRSRTLFIVGDGKQSIYSFQGADPAVFAKMQQDLKTFAQNSGEIWQDIDLSVSFRSAPEILQAVDAVFSSCSLSPSPLQHLPFRKNAVGHVEVWPLIQDEEEDALEAWQLSLDYKASNSPQKRLASLMTKTIESWLSGKSPLARPISPGDILILVRRRTSFVDTFIRSLKDHNIPVAGIDRLWLLEGIGVQDLLKIGEFLILPEDDLTLATVLKGPLFGLSEEDLFDLAYDRGDLSLWQRLQRDQRFKDVSTLLNDLLFRVDFYTPFSLFSAILGPLEGRKKWHARLGPEVDDSLDEFLNLCLLYQEERTPTLQGFLHWVSKEEIELKRDLDQSNQVRVMTVHGSKGLQAPVVFLPDTTRLPFDFPPFDFYGEAFLWLPPSLKDVSLTKEIKQKIRREQQEEYQRLLYVALTRAEDALYICGFGENNEGSWYDLVTQGLQKIEEEVEFDFLPHSEVKGKGWRLSSARGMEGVSVNTETPPSFLLPQWLITPPPLETSPKVIHPSEGEEESHLIPSHFGEFGTKRGILIHKLLEILPSVEENLRRKSALRFLEKENVPHDMALDMVQKTLNVLGTFSDLFGSESQGEVPVMGLLGESLLSGKIDRLVMGDDHIFIVDFKTHGDVPQKVEEIPSLYIKQMAIYKTALAHIYPQKNILCGLLWTELPRLDLLPESLLKKFNPSIDGNELWPYTEENRA